MSASTPQPLRPQHAEHLAQFRIPPEMIEAASVRSVSDAETRETFGVLGHHGADLGGILFLCIHPLTGMRVGGRIRLDHLLPDGGNTSARLVAATYSLLHFRKSGSPTHQSPLYLSSPKRLRSRCRPLPSVWEGS